MAMEDCVTVRPCLVGRLVEKEFGRFLSGTADLLSLGRYHADHLRGQQAFGLVRRCNVDITALTVDHGKIAFQRIYHSLFFCHPGKLGYQLCVVHNLPRISKIACHSDDAFGRRRNPHLKKEIAAVRKRALQ